MVRWAPADFVWLAGFGEQDVGWADILHHLQTSRERQNGLLDYRQAIVVVVFRTLRESILRCKAVSK